MPVIARQPRRGLRDRRLQAWPPDPLAPDQAADLVVGDSRVGADGQQVVQ
jgi:hypothetical protein